MAAEGGNAVDAAIAATLVTMVNEIGVVSPASGGFVTLQVKGGEAVTIDGWVEMPGRGLAEHKFGQGIWDVIDRVRRWDDHHHRAWIRRDARRDEGARPGPSAIRQGAME